MGTLVGWWMASVVVHSPSCESSRTPGMVAGGLWTLRFAYSTSVILTLRLTWTLLQLPRGTVTRKRCQPPIPPEVLEVPRPEQYARPLQSETEIEVYHDIDHNLLWLYHDGPFPFPFPYNSTKSELNPDGS